MKVISITFLLIIAWKCLICQTTQDIFKNNISNKDSLLVNKYSLPLEFILGGKYDKLYVSAGFTREMKNKNYFTFGLIYYKYQYGTNYFSHDIGINRTHYFAFYSQLAKNYASLFNDKLKLFLGLNINLSSSKVIYSRDSTRINIGPILGPVALISHEINYKINQNLSLLVNPQIGYGFGFKTNDKNNIYMHSWITDRINGYGEFRVSYGIKFNF